MIKEEAPFEEKKEDLPLYFKDKQHIEDFIKFFSSYLKRTNHMMEFCLKLGSLEGTAFGTPQESGHLKYFRMRLKKTI